MTLVKILNSAALVGLLVGAMGCATAGPPRELLEARSAYSQAESGSAPRLVPAQLHVAKTALDKAEAAYLDDPSSDETRDMAYLARRKAQLVEAQAAIAGNNQELAQAQRDYQTAQADLTQKAQGQLNETRERLLAEQNARIAAEKKAKEALDNLARIAAVKEETRGTVITLSGSVLFASGKSELLASARERLDQVAQALKEEDRNVVIEGHTDSQGDERSNEALSLKRAQAVRDYLVSRGLGTDRIRAEGMGENRPLADNRTSEGRANNRRVEIVLEGPAKK